MSSSTRTENAQHLLDATVVVILSGLGIFAFRSAFGGHQYLVVGLVGVAVGACASPLLRARLHWMSTLGVLIALYVLVGGVVALSDRATSGFLPSIDTVTGALSAMVVGWKELLTTNPPVGDLGNLLALPFLCGVLSAGLGLLITQHRRLFALASIPPLSVLVLAILTGTSDPVSVLLHGGVFTFITLWWLAGRYRSVTVVVPLARRDRRKRLAAAVGFLAVATAAGLIIGPNLPMVQANDRTTLREVVDPPFDPRQYPSPLARYREFLKLRKSDVLFTVAGLPPGTPIRLAGLDEYDGVTWQVSGDGTAARGSSGYFERVGSKIQPRFEGVTTDITVTVEGWTEVWIPTVGEVVSVKFGGPRAQELEDAFRYSASIDTAALQGLRLQRNDTYTMTVVLPTSGKEVPAGTGEILDVGSASSRSVPLEAAALRNWAAPLVQGIADPFTQVQTLSAQLAGDGRYSDGDATQLKSTGGHSMGRLDDFVKTKPLVGNAEQYAAAFGLMVRSPDVASHVVVGFEPRSAPVDGVVEVHGEDIEAWVEVPIVGTGWVYFKPTPDRKNVQQPDDQPMQRPTPESNTQVPLPPPIRAADPDSDPADKADSPPPPDLPSRSSSGPLVRILVIGGTALAVPLLFVVAPIVLIAWLKVRRRRRRRTEGSPSERIANGFREVLDAVADLGRPLPENSTRRELAGFIGTPSAPVLAMAADRLVFSAEPPTEDHVDDFWGGVDTVIGELREDLRRRDRWKAKVNLTSLRRRRNR